MKSRTVIFCWIVLSLFTGVKADRGSIPFNPTAEIFEPNQRALIAWSGTVEILLLSTDLKSSIPTKNLEMIPLPSEPKVELGDIESFNRAIDIINLNQVFKRNNLFRGGNMRGMGEKEPAGKVTFHEKLGVYDISIVNVLDEKGFTKWVFDYLGDQGIENATIPSGFEEIINQYISEGFCWFVFNVVDLSEETSSIKPLKYTFSTDRLFFPLKVSSFEKGFSQIDIIVITPKLLTKFPSLPIERVILLNDPFQITAMDIDFIDSDMGKLLGGLSNNYLRMWRCEGELSSFSAYDLIGE